MKTPLVLKLEERYRYRGSRATYVLVGRPVSRWVARVVGAGG